MCGTPHLCLVSSLTATVNAGNVPCVENLVFDVSPPSGQKSNRTAHMSGRECCSSEAFLYKNNLKNLFFLILVRVYGFIAALAEGGLWSGRITDTCCPPAAVHQQQQVH